MSDPEAVLQDMIDEIDDDIARRKTLLRQFLGAPGARYDRAGAIRRMKEIEALREDRYILNEAMDEM